LPLRLGVRYAHGLSGPKRPATPLVTGWAYDAEGVVRTTTGLRREKEAIAESVDAEVRRLRRYPLRMKKV